MGLERSALRIRCIGIGIDIGMDEVIGFDIGKSIGKDIGEEISRRNSVKYNTILAEGCGLSNNTCRDRGSEIK